MPVDHVKLPVGDLDASRAFYSAALAPFGWKLVYDEEPSLGFGRGDGGDDDEPFALVRTEPPNAPSHVAFTASSPAEVDAFHAAALRLAAATTAHPGSVRTAATTTRPSCSIPTATTSRPSTTGLRRGVNRAERGPSGRRPSGRRARAGAPGQGPADSGP